MAEVSEFHINKEYQDLIPPLTTQEFNELKESIKSNGQRIPIVISDRTGRGIDPERFKVAEANISKRSEEQKGMEV